MSLQDDDDFYLLMIGISFSGAILAAGGVIAAKSWETATTWLLEHQLIVPAADDPTVVLPRAAGAGLDVARLGVAAGLVIALLALLVALARRALDRRADR